MKTILVTALAGLLAASLSAETIKVYLGTQGRGESKGIYLCKLDSENGTLSEPKLAAELSGCGFVALHPNKKFLYSTARGRESSVAAFKIKDDHTLEPINTQPSEGKSPCHVSVDATGRCLLVANYSSGSVAALKIAGDGSLAKSNSSHQHEGSSVHKSRQKGPHAHSFYPGPDNKFAYSPDLGIDKVMIYKLDPATATLTKAGAAASPAGAGPRHMKFGSDGNQAYVLNELHLTVSVFDRDPDTGLLKEKQVAHALTQDTDHDGMTCSEIRVHPSGMFLYTANRDTKGKGRDSISVFKVLQGGKLDRIQNVPARVIIPRNIGVDPTGKWLLVAGQKSGNVPVFQIQKNGKLKFTGNEVNVANAMCIEFLR